MTRKSEAFSQMAPLLGITDSEARQWARHLREAGYIKESLPGHGVSPITEEDLVNFVVGYSCCRHAKHAPKYLDLVMSMSRKEKIDAADPERRLLPPFLAQKTAIGAIRALIWDVYEGRFSDWGRSTEPVNGVSNVGGISVEFGLDAAYIEIAGSRFEQEKDSSPKRVAHFNVLFANYSQLNDRPKVYHRDEDDLPLGADLLNAKRFGFLTLHAMGEILMNS